jgi:hypothetical protein
MLGHCSEHSHIWGSYYKELQNDFLSSKSIFLQFLIAKNDFNFTVTRLNGEEQTEGV